jgi:uncharacterized protein (DUF433 family)
VTPRMTWWERGSAEFPLLETLRPFLREGWQSLEGKTLRYPAVWFTGTGKGLMLMFDRITFDPQIMGGRACIRGMRIPVAVIVGQIAHGASFEEILAGYPDLEREDIQQAIEYAAWLAQEQVHIS